MTSFKSKRQHLPFLALVSATLISFLGSAMSVIALPWFVLQLTGSATQTALVALSETIATILAGLLGGNIVDRIGYKYTSVLTDLISCLALGLIPVLYFFTSLSIWALLLLAFLSTFTSATGNTARSAMIADVAQWSTISLETANSSLQAIQHFAFIIGPPVAGLLIAFFSISPILFIDALTFLLSALIIAAFVPHVAHKLEQKEQSNYMTEIIAGMQFLRQERLLLATALIAMAINFLDTPLLSVAVPLYIQHYQGNAGDLGLAFAIAAVGALAGSLLFGVFNKKATRRPLFLASLLFVSATYWGIALLPSTLTLFACLLLAGIASGPLNPLIATIKQERVPAHMRGRVFGTLTTGVYITIPLGLMLIGLLLDRLGLLPTILIMALGYTLITACVWVHPIFRHINTSSSTQHETIHEPTQTETNTSR